MSSGGSSTSTVFALDPGSGAQGLASLPAPLHDAAAAVMGGRVLVFGGGQVEGSDQVIRVQPGGASTCLAKSWPVA